MNPLPDDRPDEEREARLAAELARYDELLHTNRAKGLPEPSSAEISGTELHRLKRARAGIQLLKRARPPSTLPTREPVVPSADRPLVDGYEILGILGRGGMGVVYKARQLSLNRLVALKMIVAGVHASPEDRARFRTEAEAAARLCHPGIVQIYDIGTQENASGPMPYMALEYMDGGSLAEYVARGPLPPRAAAALLVNIARAIHYAHEQGFIHRDLKPANILFGSRGDSAGVTSLGVPASTDYGLPKVTDFGLVKRLTADDHTQFTATNAILGTATYMAPEQAQGRARDVHRTADVYSLGAIFYELLTGRPPFQGESAADTLRLVLHEDPLPPRRLNPAVSLDLETICLRCLEKEPERRYPNAQALADDLQRSLEGLSIRARPVGSLEQAWKWARRKPAIAGLSLSLIALTMLAVALITWQWREAVQIGEAEKQARIHAQELALSEATARREVERLLVAAKLDHALTRCERGEIATGLQELAAALEHVQQVQDPGLERIIRTNMSSWRAFYHGLQRSRGLNDWAWDVAFSPDERTYVVACKDSKVYRFATRTNQPQGQPLAHPFPVWDVEFSRDGRWLSTVCANFETRQGEVRLWDATTLAPLGPPLLTDSAVAEASFNRAGNQLLTIGVGGVRVLDLSPEGKVVASRLLESPKSIQVALFSPDGSKVLTGDRGGTVRLWDATTGQSLGESIVLPGRITAMAISPDSQRMALGCVLPKGPDQKAQGGEIWLHEMASGKRIGVPMTHAGWPGCVVFSRGGQLLLSGAVGPPAADDSKELLGEAQVWNAATGLPFGPVLKHPRPVRVVEFAPDDRSFATGCEDRCARVWMTATGVPLAPPMECVGTVRSLCYSADGRNLLTSCASAPAAVRLWAVPRGLARVPAVFDFHEGLTLSPDGQILLTRTGEREIFQRDAGTGRILRRRTCLIGNVIDTVWSPDGQFIAAGYSTGLVEIFHAETGEPVNTFTNDGTLVRKLAFRPDGKVLAEQHLRQLLMLVDYPQGTVQRTIMNQIDGVSNLAWSPDGQWLLFCNLDGTQVVDGRTGELEGTLHDTTGSVMRLAYSPDGKTWAGGSDRGLVQLWDAIHRRPSGRPFNHSGPILDLAYNRTGQQLLTCSQDRTARLWDTRLGKPLSPPLPHLVAPIGGVILPDDVTIVTLDQNAVLHWWDMPPPWSGTAREFLDGLQ